MAKCKDCLHVEVCREYVIGLATAQGVELDATDIEQVLVCDDCKNFKDRSRFVELPCKVGDTVFRLLKSQDILKYKVFYINIFRGEVYDDINIVLDRNYHRIEFTKERFKYELGKTIFLTKEQAEQALKEREK